MMTNFSYSFITAFQLGILSTILIWAAIKFAHEKDRLNAVILLLITFVITRILVLSPETIIYDFELTSEQLKATKPFLNLPVMTLGLFALHLITARKEETDKRTNFFIAILLLAIAYAILSLKIERIIIITLIGTTILIPCMTVIFYDYVKLIKSRTEKKVIIVMKFILLSTLLISALTTILEIYNNSIVIDEGYSPNITKYFSFIISGIVLIYLTTLNEKTKSNISIIEKLDAIKLANNQSELRLDQQRFLSMLMHEIRTPLSVIKISTDAFINPKSTIDTNKLWAQRIDTAIQNITQVIDNCVQAEKQESGTIQPKFQKIELLNEIKNLYKNYLSAEKDLDLRLKINTDINEKTFAITDVNYIRSILLNIIGNAYKYSPSSTNIYLRIFIDSDNKNNKVVFEVENSLGKIEPPDPAQLFERYYRAESAKRFAGTGLGLWLSQTLAVQIGSKIEMKTTEKNTIIFFFALQAII
jgi:signal transduction histidine kinase